MPPVQPIAKSFHGSASDRGVEAGDPEGEQRHGRNEDCCSWISRGRILHTNLMDQELYVELNKEMKILYQCWRENNLRHPRGGEMRVCGDLTPSSSAEGQFGQWRVENIHKPVPEWRNEDRNRGWSQARQDHVDGDGHAGLRRDEAAAELHR